MTGYDPFIRGSFPVGVRTVEVDDETRSETVPIEIWYPATEAYLGQDLDPSTQDVYELLPGMPGSVQEAVRDAAIAGGEFPPIIFSHGFAGHRRQTTHLCTHLASHGYVVAAPDHVGNTTTEVMGWMLSGQPPGGLENYVRACVEDRPRDASRTLDGLLNGEYGLQVSTGGAGITGHSFGGWTTLQTTARDERIVAALPLAPSGGVNNFAEPGDPWTLMSELIELSWERHVPTLMIVAEDDSVLPIHGMHDILQRAAAIDKMVVLVNADHYHFCDGAEIVHDLMTTMARTGARASSELVPGAHAYDVTKGLGLAHFDAAIRKLPGAVAFLDGDLVAILAARGIAIEVVTS